MAENFGYKTMDVIDGNEAAANAAFRCNEVCIIYPITPSSQMGELSDQWAAEGKRNAFGTLPEVIEMQSEAGAVGAIHGALQTGALATTYTSSQGLLLMPPNMYKIAAEMTPTVFHVAARMVATQAMNIYPDHSDVMAVRPTGFAILAASSVQEVQDMAIIAEAASLKSSIPFLHFFDGFRTSHEVSKIKLVTNEDILKLMDESAIFRHREKRLQAENNFIRGAVYNEDISFQTIETVNLAHDQLPETVQSVMDQFKKITGREYHTIEYFGHPEADRVIVLMASATETAIETVEHLQKYGEKVGVLRVRLYRTLDYKRLNKILPKTVEKIAVLDRTKEPGSNGEPLYQEILSAITEAYQTKKMDHFPIIIGGRYGLGGKEFTPGMVKGVLDELKKAKPKRHFTIGICDDLSNTSLEYDSKYDIESDEVIRAIFYALGADGTVGANKNTVKIIGEETDFYVQGYFVYDANKSGSKTVSHLRFGPKPIRSSYLIRSANFVACHQFGQIKKIKVLEHANKNAIFLLNSPFPEEEVWDQLPKSLQETIIKKHIKFYIIDGYKVAEECGMGRRINTVMQTCFFALSNVLTREEAIKKIKASIQKTYASKGKEVVQKNFDAVDNTLANLFEVTVPESASSDFDVPESPVGKTASKFVKEVIGEMMAGRGNELSVKQVPNDGTFESGTTCWEKRNVSLYAPVWDAETCIQCGRCSLVCPHTVITAKQCSKEALEKAPESLQSAPIKNSDKHYVLQIYPEDCTGCGLCIEACPAKNKEDPERRAVNFGLIEDTIHKDRENIAFFESLKNFDCPKEPASVKELQFVKPLFEFPAACAGCGETPYVKLLSQLFGDRMLIADACGCSLVYGGNLPTTPWIRNEKGLGTAWAGSLFEDNAEFGYGYLLTEDKHREMAMELVEALSDKIGRELAKGLLTAEQKTNAQIDQQRERIVALKKRLTTLDDSRARHLLSVADHLVRHTIWALGGDGWAYDIGFGGLDHVLASGRNIKIFILDTEVYSNTGGQASKSSPRGAVVKFAMKGKSSMKKDIGLMMMSYRNVYVARIALDANPAHAIKAIKEAESYNGPSLIIAYCQCIAHGFDMGKGIDQQTLAVKSGYWPLYRYNPDLEKDGKNPFQLDSKAPTIPVKDYMQNENRFKLIYRNNPEHAGEIMRLAQDDVDKRWAMYERLAEK